PARPSYRSSRRAPGLLPSTRLATASSEGNVLPAPVRYAPPGRSSLVYTSVSQPRPTSLIGQPRRLLRKIGILRFRRGIVINALGPSGGHGKLAPQHSRSVVPPAGARTPV